MSDRRLFVNSRVDTAQIKDTSRNLTFYGIEAARRYRERVTDINPGLNPLPEAGLVALALGKHGLPPEFRQEWKAADESLLLLLRDINRIKDPARVWKSLFGKFQYATEMPTKQQALGFINQSAGRIQHLAEVSHDPNFPSVILASRVYIENMMIRGALMGGTFFIPASKPNLN